MPAKHKIDPALLIAQAERMEILGRPGLEWQGRVFTSKQLRELASIPVFPLRPFDGSQFYELYKSS